MALLISIFYLAVLSICVAMLFLSSSPAAAVRPTNLFLGPLQGLATSFIGLFFVGGQK